MIQALKISVSVVTFDTPMDELEACLLSLFKSLGYCQDYCCRLTVSIYVVNNGDEPLAGFISSIKTSAPRLDGFKIDLLEGQGNVGYGAAINLTLGPGDFAFRLLLNSDVTLHPMAISEALKYLDSNNSVVAVSPMCVNKEQVRQHLCKRYPTLLDLALRGLAPKILSDFFTNRLAKYEMRELPINKPSVGIPLISGCFILCRASALTKVSGFDSSYFLYFEDFDLSLRLRTIGELAFLPSVKITHEGGFAARKGIYHILIFARSAFRFFNKFGWKWR